MGRNNSDFQQSALYHGTIHPFSVGDIVKPQGGEGDGEYAWATPREGLAHERAKDWVGYGWNDYSKNNRGAHYEEWEKNNPPRVYKVEPIGDTEVDDNPEYPSVKSRAGFRVIGEHDGT
jgi:hypothetical protein